MLAANMQNNIGDSFFRGGDETEMHTQCKARNAQRTMKKENP